VLDNFSLYWLTNTAVSSARIYWENRRLNLLSAGDMKSAEIALPVAVSVFLEDVLRPQEAWARAAFPNLIYFNKVERGAHFAAWEQPALFAQELRAAFGPLR
jgi:pimeloyl-ACP methyl ester carboxylesterase